MSFAPIPPVQLAHLLGDLILLCDAAQLPGQVAEARALVRRLQRGELHLAVLGQMKRGKSSLTNALLGVNVLPTGIVPLTSVVTEIRGGAEPSAQVEYKSGIKEPIDLSSLGEFVTERQNPGNRKRVSKVTAILPSPLLEPGLVLIDTPGIGSTQTHNSEATAEYLSSVDAALVVFSADPPITEAEADFLRTLRTRIGTLFFVLNKADLLSASEIEEATAFLRNELRNRFDIRVERIAVVSARHPAVPLGRGGTNSVESLREQLRRFANNHHQKALAHSVATDALTIVERATFAVTALERASSLSSTQIAALQTAIPEHIAEARRRQSALRTLLRQAEADLLASVTLDLDRQVADATGGVKARLATLYEHLSDVSGKELGAWLEMFLNEEIRYTFQKWRIQKDAWLDSEVKRIEAQAQSESREVVAELARAADGLLGQSVSRMKPPTPLAKDARVSYKITPVFFSLDSGLLFLPGFLQRRWVFRKFVRVIESELNRNAGKIRFDYLERLERTFQTIHRSAVYEIDESIEVLTRASEPSAELESMPARFRRLGSQIETYLIPAGTDGGRDLTVD